jgi:hypothetical protein
LSSKFTTDFIRQLYDVRLRSDIDYGTDVPSFERVRTGGRYLDTYDYKFVTEQREPAEEKVRAILGQ